MDPEKGNGSQRNKQKSYFKPKQWLVYYRLNNYLILKASKTSWLFFLLKQAQSYAHMNTII